MEKTEKSKRKVHYAREKKINCLEYQILEYQKENSDRLDDLHRLKAAWYKNYLQTSQAGVWHSFCKEKK